LVASLAFVSLQSSAAREPQEKMAAMALMRKPPEIFLESSKMVQELQSAERQ